MRDALITEISEGIAHIAVDILAGSGYGYFCTADMDDDIRTLRELE